MFIVREGVDAITALGVDVGEIRVSGGVTRRRPAMQLRANALRRRLVGVTNPEATTIGAAILAAVCCGRIPPSTGPAASMVRLDAPVDPEPAAADAYDRAFLRWQGGAPRHVNRSVTADVTSGNRSAVRLQCSRR